MNNILFPIERRHVLINNIVEAKEIDQFERIELAKQIDTLKNLLKENSNPTFAQANQNLENCQILIEKAAAFNNIISEKNSELFRVEKMLILIIHTFSFEEEMPNQESDQEIKPVPEFKKLPFFAQINRNDTPILSHEHIPTILSENLDMISSIGQCCREFNLKPTSIEIEEHLYHATQIGFSKKKQMNILKPGISLDNISCAYYIVSTK